MLLTCILKFCRGNAQDTRGTAFVIYEDIFCAKEALDRLNGFNVGGRYLIVLYYQQQKMMKKLDQAKAKRELDQLKSLQQQQEQQYQQLIKK